MLEVDVWAAKGFDLGKSDVRDIAAAIEICRSSGDHLCALKVKVFSFDFLQGLGFFWQKKERVRSNWDYGFGGTAFFFRGRPRASRKRGYLARLRSHFAVSMIIAVVSFVAGVVLALVMR